MLEDPQQASSGPAVQTRAVSSPLMGGRGPSLPLPRLTTLSPPPPPVPSVTSPHVEPPALPFSSSVLRAPGPHTQGSCRPPAPCTLCALWSRGPCWLSPQMPCPHSHPRVRDVRFERTTARKRQVTKTSQESGRCGQSVSRSRAPAPVPLRSREECSGRAKGAGAGWRGNRVELKEGPEGMEGAA